MAYFEQKILSCIPGGSDPIIKRDGIDASDVGADIYEGVETSDSFANTSDTLIFNSSTHQFRHKDGLSTVNRAPTHAKVFGATKTSSDPNIPPRNVKWLGRNNGESGSGSVTNTAALISYFKSNTYDSGNVYYFYNSDSGEVEEVIKYTAPGEIELVKGELEKSYINKAVTFDDGFTITNGKVRLSYDDSIVLGSILGYSYGKLQVAVDGWDIKFINGTTSPLIVGRKIVGKTINNVGGYIQEAPSFSLTTDNEIKRSNARGHVVYSESDDNFAAGKSIVKASLIFGGW